MITVTICSDGWIWSSKGRIWFAIELGVKNCEEYELALQKQK